MSNFNYEKGWFELAKPIMDGLSNLEQSDIKAVATIVKDKPQQRKDLNIELDKDSQSIFTSYNTKRLAELSRACYYVTHWKPGGVAAVEVLGGCPGWKIANIIDQILVKRLNILTKLEIHEGNLRVTFSSRDCWLWEEFGLATEKNLELYKSCGLRFGENTLEESAAKLAKICGDLWPDPDDMPDGPEYIKFTKMKREKTLQAQKDWTEKQLEDLDNKIAALKREHFIRETFLSHTSLNIKYLSNLIYYDHVNQYCFGWRNKLTAQEKNNIQQIIKSCDKLQGFDFTFKAV